MLFVYLHVVLGGGSVGDEDGCWCAVALPVATGGRGVEKVEIWEVSGVRQGFTCNVIRKVYSAPPAIEEMRCPLTFLTQNVSQGEVDGSILLMVSFSLHCCSVLIMETGKDFASCREYRRVGWDIFFDVLFACFGLFRRTILNNRAIFFLTAVRSDVGVCAISSDENSGRGVMR